MENENDMETWDGIEDYDQWSDGLHSGYGYPPDYVDEEEVDDEEEDIGYA